jgi:hypothetical protein
MGRFSTGRGRGGHGGRFSSGRGQGKPHCPSSKLKCTVKAVSFIFQPMQLGGQNNQGKYKSIKEHIVKQIKKNFMNGQDVSACLRSETVQAITAPVRKQSGKTNAAENKI